MDGLCERGHGREKDTEKGYRRSCEMEKTDQKWRPCIETGQAEEEEDEVEMWSF